MKIAVTDSPDNPDAQSTSSGLVHGPSESLATAQRRHTERRSAISGFFSHIGTTRTPCVIKLPQWQFALVWMALVALHALSSVYFFYVTYLHYYILLIEYESTIASLGDGIMSYFTPVMAVNGSLCAVNALALINPVVGSLYHRRLVFWVRPRDQDHEGSTSKNSTSHAILSRVVGSTFASRLLSTIDKLVGTTGLFGIEGEYFDIVFRVMELFENGAQTYQAFKLSKLVPTVWINRMYAILISLCCWSTPLLHHTIGHRVARHRVLCLATDTLFDFIGLTVVPLAIFLPYVHSFDTAYGDFPMALYYEDTWYINAVAENQQLFVLDSFDLLTKTVPALSVLVSLLQLRQCFVVRAAATIQDTSRVVHDQSTNTAMRSTDSTGKAVLIPKQSKHLVRGQSSDLADRAPSKSLYEKRFHRFLNWMFVIWGFVVAIVHIHATVVAGLGDNNACYLNLRPWFSTKYNCAVLEVNCEVLGHVGHAESVNAALTGFEDGKLRALIFSGCSELQLTSRIQSFQQLQMLKIYNSSVQSWSRDASLSATHHPAVSLLYIVRTNFSNDGLPEGLLSDQFPPSLQDIEFCVTNLTSLPRNLKEKWHFIQFFVLEASPGIEEFPLPLVELGVPQLSLSANNIRSIPDDLLADQAFWSVSLSGNPITTLPKTIGALSELYRIRVGYSGLSALPEWMVETTVVAAQNTFEKVVDVKLGGSPLCSTAAGVPRTGPYFAVDCTTDPTENWPLVYPLSDEVTLRAERRSVLLAGI